MVKCKIQEIIPLNTLNNNPILVNFQNGELLPEGASDMDCFIATNNKKPGVNNKMAITVTADNIYSGYINEGYPNNLVKTFIGIRNKTSKKMRLIEVQECSMQSHHYDEPQRMLESNVRNANDSRNILYKEYGGKKARLTLERTERMKMNLDVVKDELDQTMENINSTVVKDELKDNFDISILEREQYLQTMIPPMNKSATTIDQVFELNKLIDETLLNSMEDEASAILLTKPDNLPVKAKYLIDIIQTIQQSKEPDSFENLNKIKTCIYIDALINFLKKMNRRKNMKVEMFSDITEKVETDIRKRFTQPGSNSITKTNFIVHKATCYMVVLTLLISNKHEIDINNIIEEINTSKSKLLKLSSVIPVRIKAGTSLLSLKLPSQIRASKNFIHKKNNKF